ncbi:50S ribosome-binding protein YggL, partial [Salmonella enterica subsp. enterica serovar Kentucky]|nr:50S ribosome-binding protein YggL [Salmonella enterica subsp. enterica serovar Kentucky]
VIEPNKLAFDGSGYLAWEGLICMQEIGKCTEEHQAIVRKWLDGSYFTPKKLLKVSQPPSRVLRLNSRPNSVGLGI